jgi:hypothetical protein
MKNVHPISIECVEQTWQDVGSIADPDEAAALSRRFSTTQPALATFLLQWTEDLSPAAAELAYYVGLVIWQCYERTLGAPLREIQPDEVTRHYEVLDRQLVALQGVDDRLIERRILYSDDYPQPAILQYMVEAIYDPSDDGADLTPEEQGTLFIALRVVADSLDAATARAA